MRFAQTHRPGRARRFRRPAGAVLACCALSGLAAPGIAAAQQWLVTPEIEVAAQYLDNPRLREDGEGAPADAEDQDSVKGGLVDAALALRRNTPTSTFLLRPAVAVYRYDNEDEDAEAYFLDLDANGEGRRSSWRLRGNYRQQQVYRSETTSSEFDDLLPDEVQTGTGRTFVRRQRDLWRIQPGFTMNFTEVTSLAVDLTYHDVTYDVEEPGEAVDYSNTRIDVALQRALSPYNMLELGVFAFRYDPSEPARETDSAGALVGYRHSTSEVSTFFVEVGAQETRRDSPSDPDIELSETSFLWNIGYQRRLEVTTWRFDLGQEVTPSGSGNLVERDLYRAAMTHQLQPRWLLELSAVFLNADSVADEGVVSSSDRDYLQARASLGYRVTPSWTVQGLYAFTHQDFADIPGDAQEHEFRLSFIYRPPLPTR